MAYPDSHVKNIKIRYGDKEATAIGLAMPREAALVNMADEILLAGHFFDEGDQPEAILGVAVATGLGFSNPKDAVGKEVTVEADTVTSESGGQFTVGRKVLTVEIVGVYQAPLPMPPGAQLGIFLPVELMKEIGGMDLKSAVDILKAGGSTAAAGYASVTVRVRDPAYLDDVEKAIHAMGFHTQTVLSRLQDMRRFFLAIQLLLTIAGSIALSIAALGIVNTLLMAVLERYQEIGLCKAIGASDGDLFVLFLTEAGIIGLLGGLTGIALGRLMSWGMEFAASVYAHGRGISGRLDLFAFPLWLLAVAIGFSAATIPGSITQGTLMFVPGVRVMVPLQSRLSVFGAVGGGFGGFSNATLTSDNPPDLKTRDTTHGVLGGGGGLDFRLSRYVSIRVDVRDYVTGRGLGGVPGRNHLLPMMGIAFHF